jgi:hypothetical protein
MRKLQLFFSENYFCSSVELTLDDTPAMLFQDDQCEPALTYKPTSVRSQQLPRRVMNTPNTRQNSRHYYGVDVNAGTTLGATSGSSCDNSALPPENTSRRHSRVRHARSRLCFAGGFDNGDTLLLEARDRTCCL